jgi:hypothetical protein
MQYVFHLVWDHTGRHQNIVLVILVTKVYLLVLSTTHQFSLDLLKD